MVSKNLTVNSEYFCVITGRRRGQPRNPFSIPDKDNGFFFFSTMSRLSLDPTKPSVQWVLGAISEGSKATEA